MSKSAKQKEAAKRRQKERQQKEADRRAALEAREAEQSSAANKKRMIFGGVGLLIVVLIAWAGVSNLSAQAAPHPLDDFAQCLTDSGAVVYGAIEWCSYTKEQAGMFESAWKYVDYQDYTEDSAVSVTPTWKIDGQYYENVQGLQKLAAVTGCVPPWEGGVSS